MIAIITLYEDLHALEVKRAASRLGYDNVHIIECDRVSACAPVGIRVGQKDKESPASYLTANDGTIIHLGEVATIWLRRPRAAQLETTAASSPKETEFINNECQAGLTSASFFQRFSGTLGFASRGDGSRLRQNISTPGRAGMWLPCPGDLGEPVQDRGRRF